MRIKTFVVDAFTDRPFAGNPAGVCLLSEKLNDDILCSIAAEMNHAETAFIQPKEEGSWSEMNSFSLRWFTPRVEVALCGHATLASGAVLFEEVAVRAKTITFETLSGVLRVERSEGGKYLLDFPQSAPRPTEVPKSILEAVGVPTPLSISHGHKFLVLELPENTDLTEIKPDFKKMVEYREENTLCVAITKKGPAPYDFSSRVFCPWVGIDEDPVTGSAHCVLGPRFVRFSESFFGDRIEFLTNTENSTGSTFTPITKDPRKVRSVISTTSFETS